MVMLKLLALANTENALPLNSLIPKNSMLWLLHSPKTDSYIKKMKLITPSNTSHVMKKKRIIRIIDLAKGN